MHAFAVAVAPLLLRCTSSIVVVGAASWRSRPRPGRINIASSAAVCVYVCVRTGSPGLRADPSQSREIPGTRGCCKCARARARAHWEFDLHGAHTVRSYRRHTHTQNTTHVCAHANTRTRKLIAFRVLLCVSLSLSICLSLSAQSVFRSVCLAFGSTSYLVYISGCDVSTARGTGGA